MGLCKSLSRRAGEWQTRQQAHRTQTEQVTQRISEILEAIQILTHSPQIGRPVKDGNRELNIGHAGRGYVALYRYLAVIDTVLVLAVRVQ